MSLENESGPFEVRWEDFTALSKWLKNNPPPKDQRPPNERGEAFRKRPPSKKRVPKVSFWVIWLFVVLAILALFVSGPGASPNLGLLIGGLAVGFIAGAAMVFLLLVWAKVVRPQTEKNFLMLSSDEWQKGPWRIRISPEGIESTSPLATAMYRWAVIWSMGQTEDHLIYMISSQRGVAVPRRAFISDEHFDDFADTAKRYRRQAEQILDAEPVAPEEEAPRPERPGTDIRL